MAPDAPGNLVVLDIRREGGGLRAQVERWDPPQRDQTDQLFVSWYGSEIQGWISVFDGVVYLESPPQHYRHRTYGARLMSTDSREIVWRDVAFFYLVFVGLLPKGLVYESPIEGMHLPEEVKPFRDRMALKWGLTGDNLGRTAVGWRMRPGGSDLVADCQEVSRRTGAVAQETTVPIRRPSGLLERAPTGETAPPPWHVTNYFAGPVQYGDKYTVGMAGAVGPGSRAEHVLFADRWATLVQNEGGQVNLDQLVRELNEVTARLASEPGAMREAIASANDAARRKDGPGVLAFLAKAGNKALDVAIQIGAPLATKVICAAIGLPC